MSQRGRWGSALFLACGACGTGRDQSANDTVPVEEGYVELFDHADLTGWHFVGEGGFEIENGALKTAGGMGLLYYEGQTFGDIDLRVRYRTLRVGDNSGVFIRIPPPPPTDPWTAVNYGYEIQINDDPNLPDTHITGAIYSFTTAMARAGQVGDNQLDIRLDGPRTMVWVNGVLVTDFLEGDPVEAATSANDPERRPRPDEGYLGLQNHSAASTVYFEEVSYRPLSD